MVAADLGPVAVLTPPPHWGVGREIPAEVFEGLSEEELLAEMENLERLTAWLAARAVSLTERLVLAREEASGEVVAPASVEPGESGGATRAGRLHRAEVHAGLEDEIALATGIGARAAHVRRAMVVGDPEHARPIVAALARGEVSWARAMQVFSAVSLLSPEVVPGIVEALTAPYPARSVHGVGGLLVPQPVFTARLARQVARHSTSRRRHRAALADRCTWAVLDHEEGTGRFTVTGHAGRVAGAHERVDEIARRLLREGDARSLAQLRSDLALDLMLFGELPASHAALGELPPARVQVSVSLACLFGAVEEPGVLDAVGRREWVAAPVIREMAVAAGSVWQRLVTDPATGYLVDLTSTAYAVTGRLRERVLARDGITRAPGRVTPSRRCDLDHDLDHALGGASSESNLSAKDRRGHNHKTRRTWRSVREPGINGDILWVTPAGRTYATSPWDHRDLNPTPRLHRTPDGASTQGRRPDRVAPPHPAPPEPPRGGAPAPSPAPAPPAALAPPDEGVRGVGRGSEARLHDVSTPAEPSRGGSASGEATDPAPTSPLHGPQVSPLHALCRVVTTQPAVLPAPVALSADGVRRQAEIGGIRVEEAEADVRALIDTAFGLSAGDSAPPSWLWEGDAEPRGIRVRRPRLRPSPPTPWHERSAGPPPF